ncbi:unnamed protein product [Ectocarpus sp. CCAP 1310/34]|nr:unnamed protein product [Ectocarpus sp. CCAP 1310/34]
MPAAAERRGNTGTNTNGEAVAKSPELDQVCNALLPFDVQREDEWTGANKRATGGAERRAAAKLEGKRLYEMNRAKKRRGRRRKLIGRETWRNECRESSKHSCSRSYRYFTRHHIPGRRGPHRSG